MVKSLCSLPSWKWRLSKWLTRAMDPCCLLATYILEFSRQDEICHGSEYGLSSCPLPFTPEEPSLIVYQDSIPAFHSLGLRVLGKGWITKAKIIYSYQEN